MIAQQNAAPRPTVEVKAQPSINLTGVWNCQGRNTEMVMIDESGRAQSMDIPASAATFTTVTKITQQGNQLTLQYLTGSSRDGNSQASAPVYTATLNGNSVTMRYSSPTSDTVTKLIYNPGSDSFDGTSEMWQHSPGGKAGTKVITTMHMTRQ